MLSLGASAYLNKPLVVDELIRELLRRTSGCPMRRRDIARRHPDGAKFGC